MSRKEQSRIRTDGGSSLGANPFEGLGSLGNLPAPSSAANPEQRQTGGTRSSDSARNTAQALGGAAGKSPAPRARGRIDVRREKSGRGGKVVTVVGGQGLAALSQAEREALLRQLKNRFGCGGRREADFLELQGNLVEQLEGVLRQMGWRVVRTGG